MQVNSEQIAIMMVQIDLEGIVGHEASCVPVLGKTDWYTLEIMDNKVVFSGIFERSELRNLIGKVDRAINNGL